MANSAMRLAAQPPFNNGSLQLAAAYGYLASACGAGWLLLHGVTSAAPAGGGSVAQPAFSPAAVWQLALRKRISASNNYVAAAWQWLAQRKQQPSAA